MVTRFEVGKVYFSRETRYASNGKTLKEVKIKWLCVKRNDSTKYVSFRRIYKDGLVSSITEARKFDLEYESGRPVAEFVMIGHGGSGAWRNWHYINAKNKV